MAPREGELGEVLGVRLIAFFDDPDRAPSAGVSGASQELSPTGQRGVWSAEAALLTQPGDWRLETRIRRRGEDDVVANLSVPDVGGILAREGEPEGLFALPFTFVDWNVVGGGAMIALGVGAFLVWRNRPSQWQRSTSASVGLSSAFALAAGVVLLFGVDAHEATFQSDSPIPPTNQSLAMGEELFMTTCIACHGATGEGDGPAASGLPLRPPRLGDHVPYHSDGTIFLWISEGIPLKGEQKNMPSFKDVFSEEERWHLVNFLRAAFGSGEFEPVLPDAAAGRPSP
jgi:mono/diheme cytochrome c family protein